MTTQSTSRPGSERLADKAYRKLMHAITAGDFEPGERLTEHRLCKRLEMSRTPVREAINRLVADGLLASTPQCGVTVPQLDLDQIEELYYVREAVESEAARFAAKRITPEELQELDTLCDRMNHLSPADPIAFMAAARQLDSDFHRRLVEISGIAALARLYAEQHLLHVCIFGQQALRDPKYIDYFDTQPLGEEHRPLVEALRKGDPTRADRAVRKLVARSVKRLRGVQ